MDGYLSIPVASILWSESAPTTDVKFALHMRVVTKYLPQTRTTRIDPYVRPISCERFQWCKFGYFTVDLNYLLEKESSELVLLAEESG